MFVLQLYREEEKQPPLPLCASCFFYRSHCRLILASSRNSPICRSYQVACSHGGGSRCRHRQSRPIGVFRLSVSGLVFVLENTASIVGGKPTVYFDTIIFFLVKNRIILLKCCRRSVTHESLPVSLVVQNAHMRGLHCFLLRWA